MAGIGDWAIGIDFIISADPVGFTENLKIDSQKLMPWPENCIYYGANGDLATARATRYSDRRRDGAATWGTYEVSNSVATISVLDFEAAGFQPALRDRILWNSDGLEYVITNITKARFMQFYKFETQRPTITAALADTISVYRLSNAPDSTGLRVPGRDPVYLNIPGRLQPIQSQTQNLGNQQPLLNQFELYVSTTYDIRATDIIVSEGVEYLVTGESQTEQLGILARVTCERIQHGP